MAAAFVPARGDIVWITLDPQAGHEQKGRRPALVITPRAYNAKVGLAILCPITSRPKGYPFEVELPADAGVVGAVLSDHVKSVDWRARRAKKGGTISEPFVSQVVAKLATLIEVSPGAE